MAASSAQAVRSNSDANSRQEAADHLATYKQTLGSLYPLFANIGADKGLANYDKSNEYETLLKDIINANKYLLKDTSDLIDATPLLGPLLGPSKLVHCACQYTAHLPCHSCLRCQMHPRRAPRRHRKRH